MPMEREAQGAALQGSQRVTTRVETHGEPKIGIDEFMSICERFGFSLDTLERIRAVVSEEDWGEGPFLANYYSGLPETKVQAFERAAREIFGVPYTMGLSSGTGALHAALVGAGVGPDTEVICAALGFFATASAVMLAGATPVFCDVDDSLHLDPTKLEALITPKTVAIAPTHVMGAVCDMGPIVEIAQRRGLKVIEDCAQACGATYRGAYVGTLGDYGCFSISAYKIVGGGEGGLLLAKSHELWERAAQLAEAGGLWRPDRFAPPRYAGELFPGTNYRMSELEAAVDVVQLRKMPDAVARFRRAKRAILDRLQTYREIQPQHSNDPDGDVGYTLRFFPQDIELSARIAAELRAAGLDAAARGPNADPDWHSYAYMYPLETRSAWPPPACPVCDDLFERMVTVSVNQWSTDDHCRRIADAMNAVFDKHCTRDDNARAWR